MHAQQLDGRLYGLDWLRIGAFAMLILYHIGMFFVPWEWHVKTAEPLEWLELPMLALNPWRLTLLFVVSGVASRMMLRRVRSSASFAKVRSGRLLLPVLAGMLIFVAPQPWAELRINGAYDHGFWHFWLHDYFRFGELGGLILPTWMQLWFVVYLWAYTMAFVLLSLLPMGTKQHAQRIFDQAFAGSRMLWLPILVLASLRVTMFPIFNETHAFVDDPYAHLVYGLAFFFGVGLAGSAAGWSGIAARWKVALALAVMAYLVIVILDMTIAGESGDLELLARRAARSIQGWGAVVGLLGFALQRLHKDSRARRYLTDAIFPYYIAHQTIIVLVGYWIAPLQLGVGSEFLIILVATVSGCAAAYELGRRVAWLRPFIGLKRAAVRRPSRGVAPAAAS